MTPRRRRLASSIGTVILALTTALGVVAGSPPAAQAASTVTLKDRESAWAKIGPSRITSIAEVAVEVPITAVEIGLQLRASSKASGYRAKIRIASSGRVVGSFSRVAANRQSGIGIGRALGFNARAGETIHIEATVVAKKTVRL